jgi:hypothetical protein
VWTNLAKQPVKAFERCHIKSVTFPNDYQGKAERPYVFYEWKLYRGAVSVEHSKDKFLAEP